MASVTVHTLHKQHLLTRLTAVDYMATEVRESLAPGEVVLRLNPQVLDKRQLMFVVTGNSDRFV